ncbi:MAG: MoaD/ThiS family protein [Nitrospirales bacterium]
MVTILVFGHALQATLNDTELHVEVPTPSSLKAVLEGNSALLGPLLPFIERGEVLVTINKKVGRLESTVRDGDTIKVTHQINPTYEGATWHNP